MVASRAGIQRRRGDRRDLRRFRTRRGWRRCRSRTAAARAKARTAAVDCGKYHAGRGRHAFFKMPRSPVRNSAGKMAPGIDVRGDGGYVLVPPSMHPSGRPYAWSVDSAGEFALAPDWLIAQVSKFGNSCEKPNAPQTEWRSLATEGVDEGQRDNTVTRLCGHFLRHHVDPFIVLEMLQLWNAAHCRPPLPAEDVDRIVESIAGREIKRRLSRGEC